ncbi:hypothetical protein EBS80_02720 [bacterium]|nr:hypothetical protein [bacterium]
MEAVHAPNLFETAIRRACALVPDLAHVDPSRILVLAHKLPPTRLGETIGLRENLRSVIGGRDVFYVMRFHARLLCEGSSGPHDPLDTVMHELWHVGLACDGSIRPMRHGSTFDAIVRTLRRHYLKNGGEPLPQFAGDTRVRVRHFATRRLPRGWDEDSLCERTTRLSNLVPSLVRYACPFGHVVIRNRKLSRPSSCATCAKTFDLRYLLTLA